MRKKQERSAAAYARKRASAATERRRAPRQKARARAEGDDEPGARAQKPLLVHHGTRREKGPSEASIADFVPVDDGIGLGSYFRQFRR